MGVTIPSPSIIPMIFMGPGCRGVFLIFEGSGQTLVTKPANGLCLLADLNDFSTPHTDDFHALGCPGKKKGHGPAALVQRPSRGPSPKHDQTAPIDGAISSDWGQ